MGTKYNSDLTIQNILSAATKLFVENGFEKTSIQEIAASAQVSKGAIYHHFKSKQEIIDAVTSNQSENIELSFQCFLNQNKNLNAKEKLITLLETSFNTNEKSVADIQGEGYIKSPEFIVSYMKDCVDKSAPMIAELLKEGIAEHSIQTDFPEVCAEILVLLLNIWCDPSIFECDEVKLRDRLKFLQQMMGLFGVDIIRDSFIDDAVEKLMQIDNRRKRKNEWNKK